MGMKQTEIGEIPEDWQVKKISDFAPLQRGFDLPERNRIDGQYPVVYSNGVMNTHVDFKVKAPGVVTGRSGTLGKVHYIDKDFWAHNTSLWVTRFNNSFPKFVYYLFTYIKLDRFASGSGVPTLNRNDVHDYKVALPSDIEEQKNISIILTDTDNLIQATEQLINKKQLIKTATMQNLLTGKIRLTEFDTKKTKLSELGDIPSDWDIVKLGDFGQSTGGTSIESEFSKNGDYKVISIGSYSENSKYTDQGIRATNSSKVSSKILNKNDLTMILNDKTSTGNIIGRVLLIDKDNTYVYNQRTQRIEVYADKYLPQYIYFLLNSPFRQNIVKSAQGGTQIYVNWSGIKELKYPIPPILEQIKINEILSNMDEELDYLYQKLEKLKYIKQGLMQNLLTGKIRLTE